MLGAPTVILDTLADLYTLSFGFIIKNNMQHFAASNLQQILSKILLANFLLASLC